MTENKRIKREYFADKCTCGGQYILDKCNGCGRVVEGR